MKYFLTIAGVRYDYTRMEFGRDFSKKISNKCDLLVNIVGARVPAVGDAITITKEVGESTIITKWKGLVYKVQHVPLQNAVVKIIGFDLKRKLQGLPTASLGYGGTKGSAILTAEIAPTGATGLTAGSIDTTDSAINTVNFGKEITSVSTKSKLMRSDALEIVEMMSDREIKIDVDGVVSTTSSGQIGTDRSEGTAQPIVLLHGLNGVIAPDVGYSKDEIKRVKQVIIKGQGVGNNFIIGAAGSPATTDQIKQVELGFIQNNTDAGVVAQSLLSELDKEFLYTVFELSTDLHPFAYDVGDTVTVKGNLPALTLSQNLRIFAINYIVSDDSNEVVRLTLANFRRGVWARYIIPEAAADNFQDNISLNLQSTQAQQQLLATTFQEVVTGVNFEIGVTNSYTDLVSGLAFSSQKTLKTIFVIDLDIISNKKGDLYEFLLINVYDGTTSYPSSDVFIIYVPYVGKKTQRNITIEVPANSENKTYAVRGKTASSSSEVDINCLVTAYSVGN